MTQHSAHYRAYVSANSPEWQAKRAHCLARAAGVCEMCRRELASQAHHVSYRRLGHEPLEDLLAVCPRCHRDIHRHYRRAQRSAPDCPDGPQRMLFDVADDNEGDDIAG